MAIWLSGPSVVPSRATASVSSSFSKRCLFFIWNWFYLDRIDELRDNNTDTFWQSDCAQPHFINIEFQKKMKIKAISVYIDFKTDESYTPSRISVKVGNRFFDLQEVKLIDFQEPYGW